MTEAAPFPATSLVGGPPRRLKGLHFVTRPGLGNTALMLYLAAATRLVPAERWPALLARLDPAGPGRPFRAHEKRRREMLTRFFGAVGGARDVDAIVAAHDAARLRARCLIAAAAARRLDVTLDVDGLDEALALHAGGRPLLLWQDDTYWGGVLVKLALARAGVAALMFSDITHGDAETLVGRLLARPVHLAAENRLLGERVTAAPGSHHAALRRLRQALAAGRPAIVRNGAYLGRRVAVTEAPADLRFVQSTGPLTLGWRLGAAVVPVSAVEVEPFARYAVRFHPPLPLGRETPRPAAIAAAAAANAERHFAALAALPEQYLCWVSRQLVLPDDPVMPRPGMR